MLFDIVYAKLLKMVLQQLALNGIFCRPRSLTCQGQLRSNPWYILSSKVIDLSRSAQVKSKVAPHLKINCMIYRMTVENLMRLSQFAQ